MKLIEKNTGRTINVKMYIVDEDKVRRSVDVANDFFRIGE